jgi:hypothetical protein
MLVKQQQLGVFFFYTGKSHKIGEVHDGATMDWMSGARKRYYNYICSPCSWNFPMRQDVARRHCRITLILILRDTLILLEGESFFTCT